ncbi:MAG: TIR domain-containing protein [Hyphomonadaceae bacterium]
MTDVFISYAREDAAQAERIARGLEAAGLSVFWDNEIPPGQTWADYIETKLNQCAAAIVLWSSNSTKSQWVREEARMGRSKLIPARLDTAEAPFGFGDVQAADLSRWNGDYNHPEWRRFADAVTARARGGAAPHAAATQVPAAQPPPNQQSRSSAAPPSGELSPIGYVQKCLRLYVDGRGRARRKEYGWFFVFYFVVLFAAGVLDALTSGTNPYTGIANSQAFLLIAGLALLAPMVSAGSRRAHDFGQSGWLAALTIIPYLGILAVLAFIFIPGQAGPNQHGLDPKAA